MKLSSLAAALTQYRINEGRTPADLRRVNLDRFREIVRFAAKHSPYYGRIIRKHAIDVDRCTPEDFPPLTKADVVRHFDDILTTRDLSAAKIDAFFRRERPGTLLAGRYVVMHSTGTAGPRSVVAVSQEDLICALLVARRFFRHTGRRASAAIFPARYHFPSTTISIAMHHPLTPAGDFTFLDADSDIATIVNALNRLQPAFVSSYAGLIARLAHEQQAGRLHVSPADIQVNGEVLFPHRRREIEDVFQANVVDVYSSCEFLYMGWRNSSMPEMRLLEDNLIFEIHPDHLCCTSLFNRTLPLIRYRLDDQLNCSADAFGVNVAGVRGRVEAPVSLENVHGERVELCSLLPYKTIGEIVSDGRISAAQVAVLSNYHVECRVVLTAYGREREAVTLEWVAQAVRTLLASQELAIRRVTARAVSSIASNPRTGKTSAMIDLRAASADEGGHRFGS